MRVVLPRDLCLEHLVMPVSRVARSLIVAMVDPTNAELVEELTRRTGYEIEPVITTEAAIRRAVRKYFGFEA